jgi:capsular exopolysaccharide synthesis family protein
MSKVFEALERHQKQQLKDQARDPLAPVSPSAHQSNGTNGEAAEALTGFDLLDVIGAPAGRRSNEGMVFPSLNAAMCEATAEPEAEASMNGSAVPAASLPAEPETPAPIVGRELVRTTREIPVERVKLSNLHPRLILLTDPNAPECEQYRTLRTQLFLAAEKKPVQVVLITSALAGEGKTSTALNLALSIAQSKEKRVLVIDGDMRRPNVAAYLGIRPGAGLAGVLEGENEPLDSTVCLDAQELYVLPVKAESPNPTELLSSERLELMLEELREYFDFILVDSPPVMPFADARLLANHADAVVLVVRAGFAPYETVEKAIDVLPPGRMLGVVLNGAERLAGADGYDYYYNYARREERRRTVMDKVKDRVGASWLGRKMDLRE